MKDVHRQSALTETTREMIDYYSTRKIDCYTVAEEEQEEASACDRALDRPAIRKIKSDTESAEISFALSL
jgi:hypothetical protein